jgi:ribosomal protein L7/L12
MVLFFVFGVPLLFCLILFIIFYRLLRSSTRSSPQSLKEREVYMANRSEELIHQLQSSSRFEEFTHKIEGGDKYGAMKLLREDGRIEQGEVEAVVDQLTKNMRASQLATNQALYTNPNAIKLLLRSDNKAEAIKLYHVQMGVGWQEAKEAVDRLEMELKKEQAARLEHNVKDADLAVLFFLTRAGHLADAAQYYSESLGVDSAEAKEAIKHLQQEINIGNQSLPELGKREVNPAVVHFLLRAGHKMIAIRYYRDCTEASLTEANRAVEEMMRDGPHEEL